MCSCHEFKKNVRLIAFFYSIALTQTHIAYAEDEFKDLILYTENDPPYVTVDDNGEIGGLATVRLNHFLQAIKFPKENIKIQPWARSYKDVLTKKNVMIYPIVKMPERIEKLEFVYKLYEVTAFFYRLSSRKDIVIRNINEAKKYSVCVVRADYREDFLKRSGFTQLDESNDSIMNFKKFLAGRCDIAVLTKMGLHVKLQKFKLDSSLVTIAYPLSEIDSSLYIAINKGTDQKTIDALKNTAKKLK
ncbi:transporter substrate-binding domain-containing protein [Iodobacter sp. LRB]|uniref:substrate-binding periplasmic protein n=1 Tax=unclassified Iodobacter TaxID=235634 RepID=UPI000C0FA505|nr:transporter substrate-binding domain-containing protein [Iodobacter sp. BJB302]PHU99591.1 hypothetical protein CSQ88_21695 [Iodobacter sp. BJB302]